MTSKTASVLQNLFTKAINRPRYAVDPDRKRGLWCKAPGELEDIKLEHIQQHHNSTQTAEMALQTDALVIIADALTRIADSLEEKDAESCQT